MNKYEKKFARMMLMVGISIGACMIMLELYSRAYHYIALKYRVAIFLVLLVIFYTVKVNYWKQLEAQETAEAIINGNQRTD